jgi:hypothetical protein
MSRGLALAPAALPLFVWTEQSEIDRLQVERENLVSRIGQLRPHAHHRIELEARLRAITARQMALQVKIGGAR